MQGTPWSVREDGNTRAELGEPVASLMRKCKGGWAFWVELSKPGCQYRRLTHILVAPGWEGPDGAGAAGAGAGAPPPSRIRKHDGSAHLFVSSHLIPICSSSQLELSSLGCFCCVQLPFAPNQQRSKQNKMMCKRPATLSSSGTRVWRDPDKIKSDLSQIEPYRKEEEEEKDRDRLDHVLGPTSVLPSISSQMPLRATQTRRNPQLQRPIHYSMSCG